MTDWIPGLAESLRMRAEELAEPAPRRPSFARRNRAGLGVVVAALGLSSAAYAAQGLWRPQIGSNGAAAVADAGPPTGGVLDAFAALRRAQTAADRGAEAGYALRFATSDVVSVKTGWVRLAGKTSSGQPIVIIPQTTGDEEQLCLWVQSPVYAGGQACQPARRAAEGRLVIGRGAEDGALDVVGLARDGAEAVRVGEDPNRVPVVDNIFQATVSETAAAQLQVTTYGSRGQVIDAPPPLEINASPTSEQEATLRRLLGRYEIGSGKNALDYVDVAVGLCPLIGADPRPSAAQLRHQVMERFLSAGVKSFSERDAVVVTEIVSATYCLKRPGPHR